MQDSDIVVLELEVQGSNGTAPIKEPASQCQIQLLKLGSFMGRFRTDYVINIYSS